MLLSFLILIFQWTEDGSAFVIGSDITRLESETLPQFFRHNRFQSLVRQLNFYSFRKINRERNVWIYKHKLFHRDRPENLYLVRRRTCPGLDGRKQRFSRGGSNGSSSNSRTTSIGSNTKKKLVENKNINNEDDESSSSSSPMEETSKFNSYDTSRLASVKRAAEHISDLENSKNANKKARKESSPAVDTSIIRSVVEERTSRRNSLSAESQRHQQENPESDDDDDSLNDERDEKLEMLEQSMVVSDVAEKLEEYARRAIQERGATIIGMNTRARRNGAGVVTPPFASTYQTSSMSTSCLLTYDDEYPAEDVRVTDLFGIQSTSSVVTDDDSATNEEDHDMNEGFPQELLVAPVNDVQRARAISERLLPIDDSAAVVASFCMTTAPKDPNINFKIFQLIANCEKLASDFDMYRSALQPLVQEDDMLPSTTLFQKEVRTNNAQIWEKEVSRYDAVRDFKTFAVNCVQKILDKNGTVGFGVVGGALVKDDARALEHTAETWLKSVGCQ